MSNLNNFIDKTFYKIILKQFHIYENNTSDTEDKTELFKKIYYVKLRIMILSLMRTQIYLHLIIKYMILLSVHLSNHHQNSILTYLRVTIMMIIMMIN